MTIYINGKFLCQKKTGTQIYALSMLSAMRLQNIDFTILSPKTAKVPKMYTCLKVGLFKNLNLWEQISLPFFLFGKKDVLLMNFCNSAPLFGPKQIVTVHDLAFEQKGVSWFTKSFQNWYRFLIPKLCKRAISIFTVSQFSKTEIAEYYHISPSKIKLVPNSLPNIGVLGAREVNENYLLLVGAENPRKNADFILSQLDFIQSNGYKLVLLASHSTNFKDYNFRAHPALMVFNYLTKERYYAFIKHASALVYLSAYEGFGIPVLESLSLNTPVICLDLPVFRESFNDLPIYIQSLTPNLFAESLNNLKFKKLSAIDIEELKLKYSLKTSGKAILDALNTIQ